MTLCKDVCGNLVVLDGEECDLGQGIEFDGCTDECKFEDNFVCFNESGPMICSYFGQFSIELQSQEKMLNENKIEMEFQISPLLYAFSQVSINDLFGFNGAAF